MTETLPGARPHAAPARLALATLGLLLSAGAALAQDPPPPPPPPPPAAQPAPPPSWRFQIAPLAPLPPGPRTARRGDPLAVFAVRPGQAVRLDAGVDARADNWLGASLRRPLSAGQVLNAVQARPGLYCAPVKESALYSVGPCLLDREADGTFDAMVSAAFNSGRSDGPIVSDRKNLLGVLFAAPKPLTTKVAYSPADAADGPFAEARLTWTARADSKAAGAPLDLTLQLDASDDDSGTRVVSELLRARLAGGKGEVTLAGITVRVLGLGADGTLSYELTPPPADQGTAFYWVGQRIVIIGY